MPQLTARCSATETWIWRFRRAGYSWLWFTQRVATGACMCKPALCSVSSLCRPFLVSVHYTVRPLCGGNFVTVACKFFSPWIDPIRLNASAVLCGLNEESSLSVCNAECVTLSPRTKVLLIKGFKGLYILIRRLSEQCICVPLRSLL